MLLLPYEKSFCSLPHSFELPSIDLVDIQTTQESERPQVVYRALLHVCVWLKLFEADFFLNRHRQWTHDPKQNSSFFIWSLSSWWVKNVFRQTAFQQVCVDGLERAVI